MIIGLEGFGSVWSVRGGLKPERTAFYNTTGIVIAGRLRHRSRVFGQLRFNGVGGFNPKHIERNMGRVFETDSRPWQGHRSLLLHHLSDRPLPPDYYLFAVTSDRAGELKVDCDGWKSDGVVLISMSQVGEQQEAMLLMPVHSWIRGSLGRFVAAPCADRPWRASLQFMGL
jgi:hypothetical protein